jgi:hypothetical protein
MRAWRRRPCRQVRPWQRVLRRCPDTGPVQVAPSDDHALLDNEPDPLGADEHPDVRERIAVDHEEIGDGPWLEAFEAGEPERCGAAHGGGPESAEGTEPARCDAHELPGARSGWAFQSRNSGAVTLATVLAHPEAGAAHNLANGAVRSWDIFRRHT